ncbi:MAG: DUF3011 domain-containing protein [Acidobacteria bacterium]|nr:DUF3011 domain-containing protein [Acidobacteriota bacterium]
MCHRTAFKPVKVAVTTIVALLAVSFPAAAQTLRCESPDGSYRECRIGGHGRVRLVFELSNRRCNEDLSWGTASEGVVWVSGGCSAMFEVETGTEARGGSGRRVVCESLDGKLETCRADGGRGIALARQLGTTPCVEGKSWGRDESRRRIWVDDDCRGEFVLGALRGAVQPEERLGGRVVCEALAGKRHECAADTSGGAQIVRELGEKRCAYGRDWGFEEARVWVANGCSAEFAVRGRPILNTVICDAKGGDEVRCPADAKLGVALAGVLGDAPCTLGASWGFDDDEVWVSKGCHAKFALGGFRIDDSAVPATALRVVCASDAGNRTVCPADTSHGVGLVHEKTGSACVLNRTWGYDRDGIWVSDGCSAEFAVAR